MKQSCGFQVNEASDVIDHVLLAYNESSSDTALQCEMFNFFDTSFEASVSNLTSLVYREWYGKDKISSEHSCVDKNAVLMSEVRGEWADC